MSHDEKHDEAVVTAIAGMLGELAAGSDRAARESASYPDLREQIRRAGSPEVLALATFSAGQVLSVAVKDELGVDDWLTVDIWKEWKRYEWIVSDLCATLYGGACSVDKGRAIVRAALAWRSSGALPAFDPANYAHPKSGSAEEWMALVEGIGRMLYGRPEPFIRAYRTLVAAHAAANRHQEGG